MTLHLEHIVHFFPSVIRIDRRARKEPKKTDLNDVKNERLPVRTVQFRTLIWEDVELYGAWKRFHMGKKGQSSGSTVVVNGVCRCYLFYLLYSWLHHGPVLLLIF